MISQFETALFLFFSLLRVHVPPPERRELVSAVWRAIPLRPEVSRARSRLSSAVVGLQKKKLKNHRPEEEASRPRNITIQRVGNVMHRVWEPKSMNLWKVWETFLNKHSELFVWELLCVSLFRSLHWEVDISRLLSVRWNIISPTTWFSWLFFFGEHHQTA